ncbi:unnamed protein product [Schistocephalus solidus]|uniref:XPGI domain-containing protein n=1 Tax=Schistocephalus solidus TaxID=70667 RepID=A0A183TKN4_SCHSO|nr:unnamed protein product [Schistocephalus solidus]
MPDLAGLDYVMDCAPPRVTICGSRPGQFNPFSSPTPDADYRRPKNNFHVLKNCTDINIQDALQVKVNAVPTCIVAGLLAFLSSCIAFQCCHLLRALGLPCLNSPGEAEAMCAFLDTQKLVDGCVSNDGDSFLYGASRVYRHFTLNSRDTSVVAYDAAKISTDLGLSRERLVLLGLILGCDFWPAGVPGVGAVSARTFVSQSDPAVVRSCLKLHDSTPTADKPASVQSEVWKKVKDGLCGCPVEEVCCALFPCLQPRYSFKACFALIVLLFDGVDLLHYIGFLLAHQVCMGLSRLLRYIF